MNFTPNTQDELKKLNIQNDKEYMIEYLNRDYFNGLDTIERTQAKAIIQNESISFIVMDPFGMEKFIQDVKII
jgi:hypothetical protein